ncbi:bestrophin family protein [Segetibacter koreensis]|uniref:bestrophin family protein n=1 Tax=Segetibacter koreensis TaxID=398037 RepID=UPI00037533A4|nr:bestrophin family ion channel [Segetibacter koreensis]
MITRDRQNWFRLLFVWQGSVLPQILPRLLVLLILSMIVVYYHGEFLHYKVPLNASPFTLIGIALAIFLGFYNNASYDRFWEGRKLWGALLNDTRSLYRQASTMGGYEAGAPELKDFLHLLIAFVHALKHQLRQTDSSADMQRLLPLHLSQSLQNIQFKPIIIMQQMGKWLEKGRKEGKIDSITLAAFDYNLNNLSTIAGGCERIAGTPIPFTYKVMLHRTVYMYCFLLPFGLVDSIGWMTPLIVVFIAYTFMALDAIVYEIEEPFGVAPNDLALNAMSNTIEFTLREMAGEKVERLSKDNADFMVD